MKDLGTRILSDIVVFSKYAKHIKEAKRRETWEELCDRTIAMHSSRYPMLKDEIVSVFNEYVKTRKILPSMRGLQFAGQPIELAPNRMFNCSYAPIDDYRVFREIMFLLLGGSGVGYSVQNHHVDELPAIRKPSGSMRFLVQDSIIGWSDAVHALFKAYLKGKKRPIFDFRDIRKKGTPLKTSGGKAPGPEGLKGSLAACEEILSKNIGNKLTPLQVHDCLCHLADAVLSGGIRRAAMIAFFTRHNKEMLECKFGDWYLTNPQRARANNSAVFLRADSSTRYDADLPPTKNEFNIFWERVKASGSGEPGIYWTRDLDILSNPCGEISLRPFQFCNLTTINCSTCFDQAEFIARAKAAAFVATLQAGYTDFHYLRDIWRTTTEEEALIGVSATGIAANSFTAFDRRLAAASVVEENARVASIIGINPAARTTCVKPEGTSSLVLGTSSGIHPWHSPFYIRRVRVNKEEAIYSYLKQTVPELVEDDIYKPDVDAVISIPVKAPKDAVLRSESALDFLERVKDTTENWIKPGHVSGKNTHNVSATVSVRPEEWDEVREWMWDNRNSYSGLSVLPYEDHTYVQAPLEECDEFTYNILCQHLKDIDLTQVIEDDDSTELSENLACAGGACTI